MGFVMSKEQKEWSLKVRFLSAVVNGELGEIDEHGHVVTLKQFKAYFVDIKTDYINSFLPAATIEPGLSSCTHTKYIFRIRNGVYRVHNDAIDQFIEKKLLNDDIGKQEGGITDFDGTKYKNI